MISPYSPDNYSFPKFYCESLIPLPENFGVYYVIVYPETSDLLNQRLANKGPWAKSGLICFCIALRAKDDSYVFVFVFFKECITKSI